MDRQRQREKEQGKGQERERERERRKKRSKINTNNLLGLSGVRESCSRYPCLNGGACMEVPNGYECRCAAGYGGLRCEVGKITWMSFSSHHSD